MGDRSDKDQLEKSFSRPKTPSVCAASAGSLPTEEPEERSLEEQRVDLARRADELEGALRYMGSAHPQRERYKTRLLQLRMMVQQIDEEIAKSEG